MAPELIPTDVPRITVTSSEVIKSVTIPKIIAINRAVYLWLMRVARERWLNTLDSISMVSCSKSVTTCLEEQDMDENTHSMFGGDGVGGGSDKLLDRRIGRQNPSVKIHRMQRFGQSELCLMTIQNQL